MASGGGINETFAKFATKGAGKEATSKDITKWCTDAGIFGKKCSSNNMDIAFSAVKPKGKTVITVKELQPLIDRLAKTYMEDKKLGSEDDAKAQIKEKMAAASPKSHGATKVSKTGGVGRMTDASKYTGSHKERFDAGGKGKGKEGRADIVENKGYVGAYKGEGTYEKK